MKLRNLFILAFFVLVLSACSNNEDASSQINTKESASVSTNNTQEAQDQENIEIFEAENIETTEKNTDSPETTNEQKEELDEIIETWKTEDVTYIDTPEFGKDLDKLRPMLEKNDTGKYTSWEESIWNYVQERFEYYDYIEGGYSGDKYYDVVFIDAGIKYGISASGAEAVWNKVDKSKLGLR